MSFHKHLILVIAFCAFTNVTIGQPDEQLQPLRDRIQQVNPPMVSDTSKLNAESSKKGFRLYAIEPTPCNSEAFSDYLHRISRRSFREDTLRIELAITANCGASFIGEIQVLDDTTLNLLYTVYGDEYFCHCCFLLTYCIEAKLNTVSTFLINGKPALETDRVLKEKTEEKQFYENGETKTLTRKLEGEVQEVIHYGVDGNLTGIDTYQNGKLTSSYSAVDGRATRPDGTVLWERKK